MDQDLAENTAMLATLIANELNRKGSDWPASCKEKGPVQLFFLFVLFEIN